MWSTPLLVMLVVAPASPARGESSVGVTGGVTLSGDQDVNLVQPRVGSTEAHDVSAAPGPVGGTTASLWLTHFGLQVDGLYWGTSAPGVLPRSLKTVRINQDRGAVLGSFTGRVFLDEPGEKYAYGGLGCGVVAIGLHPPGQTNVVPSFGALVGIALPMTSRFRLRVEARYLLTHDNMDPRNARGLSAEVSGSRGPNPGRAVFGPHFDTEFVPLLI